MYIRRNDEVIVISGKWKGQRGKVLRIIDNEKVVVEKVNMVKRHQKPTQQNPRGGIVTKEAPIHISNVNLYDEASEKASRVGWNRLEDGSKVRVFKKSGEQIDAKE